MSEDEVNHSQVGNVFMLGAGGIFGIMNPRTQPTRRLTMGRVDQQLCCFSRGLQRLLRTPTGHVLLPRRGTRHRGLVRRRH